MSIEQPLFEAERICFGPIDMDKDPEIEARWTNDPSYLRMLSTEPARPLAPSQVKKKYEAIEKEQEDKGSLYYFTVRLKPDDRLIGFARLYYIEWSNGCAHLQVGIGEAADRGCGYGKEALRLLLRFAFAEANLYRVSAVIPEYNLAAQRLAAGAGFVEEVRRRQAVFRDGRRWDLAHWGLLREEWRP